MPVIAVFAGFFPYMLRASGLTLDAVHWAIRDTSETALVGTAFRADSNFAVALWAVRNTSPNIATCALAWGLVIFLLWVPGVALGADLRCGRGARASGGDPGATGERVARERYSQIGPTAA